MVGTLHNTGPTAPHPDVNVLDEIDEHLVLFSPRKIVWIKLCIRDDVMEEKHFEGTFEDVMGQLQGVEYDYYCMPQCVYGNIWYEDGSWSERMSFSHREWWQYCHRPDPNDPV